jgi:hypothetical protein
METRLILTSSQAWDMIPLEEGIEGVGNVLVKGLAIILIQSFGV